jgi:hypothetical protein
VLPIASLILQDRYFLKEKGPVLMRSASAVSPMAAAPVPADHPQDLHQHWERHRMGIPMDHIGQSIFKSGRNLSNSGPKSPFMALKKKT